VLLECHGEVKSLRASNDRRGAMLERCVDVGEVCAGELVAHREVLAFCLDELATHKEVVARCAGELGIEVPPEYLGSG
jgi:hypothetical protein